MPTTGIHLNPKLPPSLILPRIDVLFQYVGLPSNTNELILYISKESGMPLPVDRKTLRKEKPVKENTTRKILRWALRAFKAMGYERRALLKTIGKSWREVEGQPDGNWIYWKCAIAAWRKGGDENDETNSRTGTEHQRS